jgi:hypothetical protein
MRAMKRDNQRADNTRLNTDESTRTRVPSQSRATTSLVIYETSADLFDVVA